jgi:hypothetical protein
VIRVMHKSVVALALSLGCTLIASCGDSRCNQGSIGTGKAPATEPNSRGEVIALLRQALKDSDAWDKRVRSQSDRWPGGQFHSVKHWYEKYPVAYAKERLIARGSVVARILLEVTRDPKDADIHFVAWQVLGKLTGPTYLKELSQASKQGRLSPGEVSALVQAFLPVRRSVDYVQDDKVVDWMGRQIADKNCDDIVLDVMDELVKAKYEDGGMYPGVMDERVLRWLGRIYDIDLDSWLATKAPVILKFRQEQLSKGYDPASSFNCDNNIANGLLDEAMVAIYSRPQDQEACKQLLDAVYPNELPGGVRSPLHPQMSPGWEQRLKGWYWSQRPSLRYDSSLLRFVPKRQQAGSHPEAMLRSQ